MITRDLTNAPGIPPPGYRLPAATRPGAVRLQVSDLRRSLRYYTGVLGLSVTGKPDHSVLLVAPGGARTLVELHEGPGVRPAPREGRIGLYHFALLVPDRAALGRFVTHLRHQETAAGAADHLVSEALYLRDPDGLGIEVYADRPREAWRTRGRELVMTTAALNLQSLVDAAAGAPWTGLPAETAVGHVHLHVGELAAAEAFYHSALGFDKVMWSYPGALFLSAGGYHHHLGTNIWASGAPPAATDEARLLEWELVLPSGEDVRAAATHVRSAGYFARDVGDDQLLTDPWGTTLRLTKEGL